MRLFVSRTAWLTLAWALLIPGCEKDTPPARAQWVVQVQTDAPVPSVVDRILIELLDESGALACPTCRRDAAAHGPDEPAVSFGVEATTRALYLRTRMYRVDHVSADTGQPDPQLTLDNVVRLPAVGDQIMQVYANLKLSCLGRAATIPGTGSTSWSSCVDGAMQQPAEASLQPPAPGFKPGTSELLKAIRRGGCVTPADDVMACVPGGAFFLGSTLAPAPHSDVTAAPIPERLVGVHSFRIDRHEVTVEQFRQVIQLLIDRGIQLPACGDPQPSQTPLVKLWCRDVSKETQKLCSLSTDTSVSTELPMNCASAYVAAAFCAIARKGRLPTEAEWEYAASNGSLETRFPWGDTRPDCSYAALARDPYQQVASSTARECLVTPEGGPVPKWQAQPGSLLDLTSEWSSDGYKTQSIYDLGGNVAEWTADYFESYELPEEGDAGVGEAGAADGGTDAAPAEAGTQEAGAAEAGADAGADKTDKCWAPGEVILIDRRCHKRKPTGKVVVRGGSWRETLDGAWAANRASLTERPASPPQDIGFRCACDLDQSGNCCLKNKKDQCCELGLNVVDKTLECCAGTDCCAWDLIGARCTN